MSIYDKRLNLEPAEYDIEKFSDKLDESFWIVTQYPIDSDVHDYKVSLDKKSKSGIKNTLLAISQVEVGVKEAWIKVADRFPKPEIKFAAISCAYSEVRHAKAYSQLLKRLNLQNDFIGLLEKPAIKGRVDYLQKSLYGMNSQDNKEHINTLALFTIFIENISLFSQFAIIKSFYKHKNMLKGVDTIVNATMKEELLHAQFGFYLINQVKKEFPEWFDKSFYNRIYEAADKAVAAESKIIDWIFEEGELDFLTKETLKEFIKSRFNDSIKTIGGEPTFNINKNVLVPIKWFEEDILAKSKTDFFNQHDVSYSIGNKSFGAEDLF